MAVNLFTGATSNAWGTTTNWSLGVVPTATDGHITTFDATSPACSLVGANRVANAVDCTGYTGTLTMGTVVLNISGDLTFGSGMTITGTALNGILINANSNIRCNGYSVPVSLSFGGTNITVTLLDDLYISNRINMSINGDNIVNGFNIYSTGNVVLTNNGSSCNGTTIIHMLGTSSIGVNSSAISGYFGNKIVINTTGTITLAAGTLSRFRIGSTGGWQYISGTISQGGVVFDVGTATALTIDSSGMTFSSFSVSAACTITLASDMTVGGITFAAGGIFNGNNLNITGGISLTTGTGVGTTQFNCIGSGTLTGNGSAARAVNHNLNINTPSGTYILGSFFGVGGSKTFKVTAGKVVTDNSVLVITTGMTLDTSYAVFDTLQVTGSTGSFTLASELRYTGLLTTPNNVQTFNGANIYAGSISSGNIINGTSTVVFNSSGTLSGDRISNNIVIDTSDEIVFSGITYNSSNTINYIKGRTRGSIIFTSNATVVNAHKLGLTSITATGVTISLGTEFFTGTPNRNCNITGGTYTFQGKKSAYYTKYTILTNCTASQRGQLICTTIKSNNGGNTGIVFGNQLANGFSYDTNNRDDFGGFMDSTFGGFTVF